SPLETKDGDPYRWVRSGGFLRVAGPAEPTWAVQLDLGPGDAVGWGAFDLEVYDEADRLVARGRVGAGRQTVELRLPAARGGRGRFRFVVPGGDRPCPDGWVRSFRVFGVSWADGTGWFDAGPDTLNFAVRAELPAAEVVGDETSVRLGRGWLPPREWQ